jgi:RNA polymerase sigma factor (sigma-70 family)
VAEIESVESLVAGAQRGNRAAWNQLVERYSALVWSVCRRYRLSDADAADASQTVWLRLTEHIDEIRNPAGLATWLCTTAGRVCLRIIQDRRRQVLPGLGYDSEPADDPVSTAPDRNLMADELRQALLIAIAELPEDSRRLLVLLLHDPPLSYKEISQRSGMAIGSIGPTRARLLERLRRSAALASFGPDRRVDERR